MEKIPVIYYHSIGKKHPKWPKNYLTLELPFFEDQLKYLSKKFNSISLKEFWEIRNGKKQKVKNPVVVTFDDGYLDNWIWAFPLLKKYKIRATIFVSPEFVDPQNIVRPNLEDVWNGKASYKDLNHWGFLSWEEMKIMEDSKLISIESHTMTHTKHIVSDKIVDFHKPGFDSIYILGNLFPDRKPFYINDGKFENLLPYGYPIFEMKSAVNARKIELNPNFVENITRRLKSYDFNNFNFKTAFKLIENYYGENKENAIISRESYQEYLERLQYEIGESKSIIESKLNKTVNFLCWPHGDNNPAAHKVAKEVGFLATTIGSKEKISDSPDRIPERIGLYHSKNNRFLSKIKTKYKIGFFLGKFPWIQIRNIYFLLKYRKTA